MASASGPAGRPTPSLISGRRGVSSSDKAAGERHDNQRPPATTRPTETTTMITARAVSTTTDWPPPTLGATRLCGPVDYETAGVHPQGIAADSVGEGRVALDILDGDGNHTIVTIQAPTPA
jgi:hypothetical protein